MQAIGSGFGLGQRLLTRQAVGHARHLQVGFDRGQRAAQLVGRIAGQAPLTFKRFGDTRQQLVLGIEQGFQFAGQRVDLQRLQRIGITSHQGIAHAFKRRQPLPDAQPQQEQTNDQGHAHRHRGGEQYRQVQRLAFHLAVGRGDAHIATIQRKGAPHGAINHLIMKAGGF